MIIANDNKPHGRTLDAAMDLFVSTPPIIIELIDLNQTGVVSTEEANRIIDLYQNGYDVYDLVKSKGK